MGADKQHSADVISIETFRAATQKRQNQKQEQAPIDADQDNDAPSDQTSLSKKFVAFNVREQSAIINLHAEFSIASRDYHYGHGDDYALIALLACCISREELVVFTKTLDEKSQKPSYHVSGHDIEESAHDSLKSAIQHARPSLKCRADTVAAENKAAARRTVLKLV